MTDQFLSQVSSPMSSAATAVRPVAPIVLTAEALSSLLSSHVISSGASQQTQVINHELLQLLLDQSQNSGQITLSLDAINMPDAASTPGVEQVSNDMNVGAQEMVLEDEDSSTQKHPLHS